MNIMLVFFLFIFLLSCRDREMQRQDTDEVKEIRLDRPLKPSEIIRNPLSASGLDTGKMAVILFRENTANFDMVTEGEIIEKNFTFTNIGKSPLYLLDVFSTCGCTIANWPKERIAPGEQGTIQVKFNTEGKINKQKKTITIVANTYPSETTVFMEGTVLPKINNK
jgi:hypothetical protein